jgi:hypothetical protein
MGSGVSRTLTTFHNCNFQSNTPESDAELSDKRVKLVESFIRETYKLHQNTSDGVESILSSKKSRERFLIYASSTRELSDASSKSLQALRSIRYDKETEDSNCDQISTRSLSAKKLEMLQSLADSYDDDNITNAEANSSQKKIYFVDDTGKIETKKLLDYENQVQVNNEESHSIEYADQSGKAAHNRDSSSPALTAHSLEIAHHIAEIAETGILPKYLENAHYHAWRAEEMGLTQGALTDSYIRQNRSITDLEKSMTRRSFSSLSKGSLAESAFADIRPCDFEKISRGNTWLSTLIVSFILLDCKQENPSLPVVYVNKYFEKVTGKNS